MVAAAAIFSATSCTQELENNAPEQAIKSVEFTAYVDGADTKTELNGYTPEWKSGDRIWILNGKEGDTGWKKAYSTEDDQTTKATFIEEDNSYALEGDEYFAIYPAGAADNATWEGEDVLGVKLESNQDAVAGSYDPAAHIAVAKSENTNLKFNNAVSLFQFNVKNEGVKSVTIYTNDGEALTGSCNISAEGNVTPWTGEGEANPWVELSAGDGTFEVDKNYFIAVFPNTLAGGFTVEFSFDGTTKLEAKKFTGNLTIERNQILDLGELEYVAPSVTPDETSEWALNSGWDSDTWTDKYFVTTTEADVVVIEGVAIEATKGFLVRKPSTEWADKYGAGSVNYLKANHYITTSKEGADMCLEADGTYDIYFNVNTKVIYVMTAGVDYTTATEQIVDGEEPKQEEPEVTENILYMKPNSNWYNNSKRCAAYFFNSNGGTWVSMTDSDSDGIYEVNIPDGYTFGDNVIFCSMDPNTTANNWTNKWNQTTDLTIPTDDKNLFTVGTDGDGWNNLNGTWSVK